MPKPKPTFAGIKFDSPDEIEMYHWCFEARQAGILTRFEYQWQTWELAPPVVLYDDAGRKRKSIRKTTYTADFSLWFASAEMSERCGFWGEHVSVDVKPKFERADSKSAIFSIKQKMLYAIHRTWVHPVVPVQLFQRTWLPKLAALTPGGKIKQASGYRGLKTVENWMAK